jgi:hypothetical protein
VAIALADVRRLEVRRPKHGFTTALVVVTSITLAAAGTYFALGYPDS